MLCPGVGVIPGGALEVAGRDAVGMVADVVLDEVCSVAGGALEVGGEIVDVVADGVLGEVTSGQKITSASWVVVHSSAVLSSHAA